MEPGSGCTEFIVLGNTSVQSHFACSVCGAYPAIVDMSVHVHTQYVVQVLYMYMYMYVHRWIIALWFDGCAFFSVSMMGGQPSYDILAGLMQA